MARVLRLHKPIGPAGLSIDDVELQQPGPGEVRVRVSAFALNWGDIDHMHDNYTVALEDLPLRFGDDIVGIVDALGEGVSEDLIRQRVCTIPYFYGKNGMHGEFAIVSAKYLVPAYEGFTDAEACSVWTQYITAYYPLVALGHLKAGDRLLITAATSTAGIGAIKVAKMLGVETICTTRNLKNAGFLKAMGGDHVVVTGEGPIAGEINSMTDGAGVNMVFDAIGGRLLTDYAQALAQDSLVVIYGGLSGEETPLPELELTFRNATLRFFSAQNYNAKDDLRQKAIRFILDGFRDGRLPAIVDREFQFEEFEAAYNYMASARQTHGKIVINIT